MRKTEIRDGIVTRVIEINENDIPPWAVYWPDATDEVSIGWKYENGTFQAPPPNFVDREVWRSTAKITFIQLISNLVAYEWVTQDEARLWLQRNGLPEIVWGIIQQLPIESQFQAEVSLLGMTEADRSNPLVGMLMEAKRQTLDPQPTQEEMQEMVDGMFGWT